MLCGVNLPFGRLSLCVRQVTYALRTRAPVSCIAAIPLNLHVLGLSLAFILSQDQTLHCKKNYLSLYKSFFLNSSNLLFFPFLHLSNIVNDRISLFRRPNSFAWSGCKGKEFFLSSKCFFDFFFRDASWGVCTAIPLESGCKYRGFDSVIPYPKPLNVVSFCLFSQHTLDDRKLGRRKVKVVV